MANYHPPEDDQQVRASRADEPSPDLAAQTTQPDQSVVKAATAPPNAQAAPPSTLSPQPKTLRIDGKPEPVIVVRDLKKTYHLGKQTHVYALQGISLEVYPGEFVAVMGPSGSGKSTFMNLIGCLDRPTSGEYYLDGQDVSRLAPDDLAAVRNRKIGFIFQGFNLLPRMSALGNVILPMVYAGLPKSVMAERAKAALVAVGLGG